MARFYGTPNGKARTQATRCGSKSKGIFTKVMGWNGIVTVEVFADGDKDRYRVVVGPHPHNGGGTSKVIAEGLLEIGTE